MKQFYIRILLVSIFLPIMEMQGQSSYLQVIRDYLKETGMSSEDLIGLKIQRESFSNSMKLTNVYVVQEYNEIPIYNAIGSFAIKEGKVFSFSGTFYEDISKKTNTSIPVLEPADAVRSVTINEGLQTSIDLEVLTKSSNGTTVFYNEQVSQEQIPVHLVYVFKEGQLVLSWDVSMYTLDRQHWHSIRVDATNGGVIDKEDWVTNCSFELPELATDSKIVSVLPSFGFKNEVVSLFGESYKVFPIPSVESPNHGNRVLVTNPADRNASPFGWHDIDGADGVEYTITRGNNVLASEDINAMNFPISQPDGGVSLTFDFPLNLNGSVENFEDASVTQLFYANNVIHDVWYQYGFDERSGNFQFNNYEKGGKDSDEVFADAQDGSDINNANFSTPPDGANPRMQMFLWNPVPDASVDTFVINNGVLAGSYLSVDNSFSRGHVDAPIFPDGLTADLVLVRSDSATNPNTACDDILNRSAIASRIAVIKKGACNFDEQVYRCQESGAIAVVVINDQISDPFAMDGNMGAIQIPAIMIGRDDGIVLIEEMASRIVNVTISDIGRNIFAEDSSFDNGIVIHEYGHGISSRLTGGADNSGCLTVCTAYDSDGNCISATEQMGEGWSDWLALMMTIESSDRGKDARGIGTYTINQSVTGRGIRSIPYSSDLRINSLTYKDTNDLVSVSAPHGIGAIWASMLWDLSWELIEKYGFDSDLYNGTGGNNLAMQLVIDGLKLQPCNPGFVDARDAIITADMASNEGENTCLIWKVFAKRGLGWSARQGDPLSRIDQTEAFDIPPPSELQCLLTVGDFEKNVFRIAPNPSNGQFVIHVSRDFGESDISITDVNGRIVFDQIIQLNSSYSIDIPNLRSGIYLLQIVTKGGNKYNTKIVIR